MFLCDWAFSNIFISIIAYFVLIHLLILHNPRSPLLNFSTTFFFWIVNFLFKYLYFNYCIFYINSSLNIAQSWDSPAKVVYHLFLLNCKCSFHIFSFHVSHIWYLFIFSLNTFLASFMWSAAHDEQLTWLNLSLYSFVH